MSSFLHYALFFYIFVALSMIIENFKASTDRRMLFLAALAWPLIVLVGLYVTIVDLLQRLKVF